MLFAIDFDGTIVDNDFPAIGKFKENTVQFIKDLENRGHVWTLFTMREGEKLQEAISAIKNIGLNPTYINDNPNSIKMSFNCNPRKVFAHVYIDDRNAFTVDEQINYFRKQYDI